MQSAPGSIDTRQILDVCAVEGRVDRLLLRELLGYFVDENARRLDACAAALARGDRRALRDLAHAVRGSAALFGAGRLYDLAWALEQDAGIDGLTVLGSAIGNLRGEYDRVVDALRRAHPDAWID